MNEFTNYFILGLIQGVTEFFPISSSGHLVLFENFLKIKNSGASAEIIAHFGTLFSIILYYRSTFFSNENSDDFFHINTIKMLIVSTIPAVFVGFFFDVEVFFKYDFVKISLLVNGIILIILSNMKSRLSSDFLNFDNLNYKTSFFLGCCQAFAMLPGISRSGMVISAGLFAGLEKKKVIQYAFFMAIPVILLSIIYKFLFSNGFNSISIESSFVLFISSFAFGYFSLVFLIKFLEKYSFMWFGFYCILISFIL